MLQIPHSNDPSFSRTPMQESPPPGNRIRVLSPPETPAMVDDTESSDGVAAALVEKRNSLRKRCSLDAVLWPIGLSRRVSEAGHGMRWGSDEGHHRAR
eukprot:2408697-Prymnesium_polylepis.1